MSLNYVHTCIVMNLAMQLKVICSKTMQMAIKISQRTCKECVVIAVARKKQSNLVGMLWFNPWVFIQLYHCRKLPTYLWGVFFNHELYVHIIINSFIFVLHSHQCQTRTKSHGAWEESRHSDPTADPVLCQGGEQTPPFRLWGGVPPPTVILISALDGKLVVYNSSQICYYSKTSL